MNAPAQNVKPQYLKHHFDAQDAMDMIIGSVKAMGYDHHLESEIAMAMQGVKDSIQRWRRTLWDEEMAYEASLQPEPAPEPMVIIEESPVADELSFLDSTPAVVDNDGTANPQPPKVSTMSVLDTVTYYQDDKINGDARFVFKWHIKADADSCDIDTFIHGLLLSRKADSNGKSKSFTRAELLDLCVARGFTCIPKKSDGSLHKGNATKHIGAIVTRLKGQNSYDQKTLEKMNKNTPTAASYPEEFLEDDLGTDFHDCGAGDDLDALCADYCDDDLEDEEVEAAPAQDNDEVIDQEPRRQAPTINDAMARLGLK